MASKAVIAPGGAIAVAQNDFIGFEAKTLATLNQTPGFFYISILGNDGKLYRVNTPTGLTLTASSPYDWAEFTLPSGTTWPQAPVDGWIVAASFDGVGNGTGGAGVEINRYARTTMIRMSVSGSALSGGTKYLYAQVARWVRSGSWSWVAGQPSEDYWERPLLYTFQGTVVNGAGGAGDQTYLIVPASGGRLEILAIDVANLDTSARTITAVLDDGANELSLLLNASTAAASARQWPHATSTADNAAAGNGRVFIAGSNRLLVTIAAVAASQDTRCSVTMLVWGGAPTITLAGASTPTLTTNTSRFETG